MLKILEISSDSIVLAAANKVTKVSPLGQGFAEKKCRRAIRWTWFDWVSYLHGEKESHGNVRVSPTVAPRPPARRSPLVNLVELAL